ncbi:hypothetical protein Mal15_00900 [Stieleria maiorica]|uniref:Cytochrome oxidase complex assembly protein 1 n=1 Tax=Stieleria maiorica TaxID=2795974 RepID=A0A5B9M932_9BACT|nr:hypothetical protein [Stieleria maiorica]QEF96064.1 hypothetical protein Mal15_00900 [Stieleria maiorica]
MSQAPRNPFETAPDQFGQPARKSSNTWLWVLGIIGGVFLFGTILCCGAMYFAWDQAAGVLAEVAVEEYADDPIVMEKIGTIQSSQMNLRDAMKESTKDESITAMVFEVQGDKGSGKIIHRTNNQTQEVTVTLLLDSGEAFELDAFDESFDGFDAELEGLEDQESINEEAAEMEAGENSDTQSVEVGVEVQDQNGENVESQQE